MRFVVAALPRPVEIRGSGKPPLAQKFGDDSYMMAVSPGAGFLAGALERRGIV